MNRPFPSRTLPFLAATLALPCLLTACTTQAEEPANTATATTTTAATTEDASTSSAATNQAAAPTEAGAAEAPASAEAPANTAAPANLTYREDREIPAEMASIAEQLKKVQVPTPPKDFKVGAKPRVRLVTSKGSIVVALDPKAAPLHVKSFVYLAKRGYFNGTTFHRWADLTGAGGAIIQGGDPLSRDPKTREMAGVGGPGYNIPRERNNLKHEALVIAAARSKDPDSAGSQFYITQAPTYFLDDGDGYTVFGKVVEGGDVAKKLRQNDKFTRAEVLK